MRFQVLSLALLILPWSSPLTTTALGRVEPAQVSSNDEIVSALQQGGHVIVMRHASSPRETPNDETANADNVNRERQLDTTGRTTAEAMGDAVRALGIPVGEVLSSPTYRALETVRLAGFPEPETHPELGDRGRSMQGVTEADGRWLRERAAQPASGTNTLIVTHSPNIGGAFPEVMPGAADGEALVFKRGGDGAPALVGRIRIEEWPELRR